MDAELIKGSGGEYEITLNDELIYSKNETGVFPDEEKLISLIKEKTD